MTSRFMTDPHAMRDMAGRFEVHAQTVEDEARRMWASAQNISGAGWSGMAEATSLDTMTQMNQAFRNIVNMLHGVRDGLVRDANNYDRSRSSGGYLLDEPPDMTPSFPRTGVSGHAGAVQLIASSCVLPFCFWRQIELPIIVIQRPVCAQRMKATNSCASQTWARLLEAK